MLQGSQSKVSNFCYVCESRKIPSQTHQICCGKCICDQCLRQRQINIVCPRCNQEHDPQRLLQVFNVMRGEQNHFSQRQMTQQQLNSNVNNQKNIQVRMVQSQQLLDYHNDGLNEYGQAFNNILIGRENNITQQIKSKGQTPIKELMRQGLQSERDIDNKESRLQQNMFYTPKNQTTQNFNPKRFKVFDFNYVLQWFNFKKDKQQQNIDDGFFSQNISQNKKIQNSTNKNNEYNVNNQPKKNNTPPPRQQHTKQNVQSAQQQQKQEDDFFLNNTPQQSQNLVSQRTIYSQQFVGQQHMQGYIDQSYPQQNQMDFYPQFQPVFSQDFISQPVQQQFIQNQSYFPTPMYQPAAPFFSQPVVYPEPMFFVFQDSQIQSNVPPQFSDIQFSQNLSQQNSSIFDPFLRTNKSQDFFYNDIQQSSKPIYLDFKQSQKSTPSKSFYDLFNNKVSNQNSQQDASSQNSTAQSSRINQIAKLNLEQNANFDSIRDWHQLNQKRTEGSVFSEQNRDDIFSNENSQNNQSYFQQQKIDFSQIDQKQNQLIQNIRNNLYQNNQFQNNIFENQQNQHQEQQNTQRIENFQDQQNPNNEKQIQQYSHQTQLQNINDENTLNQQQYQQNYQQMQNQNMIQEQPIQNINDQQYIQQNTYNQFDQQQDDLLQQFQNIQI